MRLEHLRSNFAKMTFNEQLEHTSAYRKKREKDLTSVIPLPPKAAKKVLANGVNPTPRGKKEKMIPVTPEALELLKKLGLV